MGDTSGPAVISRTLVQFPLSYSTFSASAFARSFSCSCNNHILCVDFEKVTNLLQPLFKDSNVE